MAMTDRRRSPLKSLRGTMSPAGCLFRPIPAREIHQQNIYQKRHAEAGEPRVAVDVSEEGGDCHDISWRCRISLCCQETKVHQEARESHGDAERECDDGRRVEAAG